MHDQQAHREVILRIYSSIKPLAKVRKRKQCSAVKKAFTRLLETVITITCTNVNRGLQPYIFKKMVYNELSEELIIQVHENISSNLFNIACCNQDYFCCLYASCLNFLVAAWLILCNPSQYLLQVFFHLLRSVGL